MKRQFCLTHTVRYDECDWYGLLTPAAFLRYMQDIAGHDAEDAQLPGDGAWIVKRTVITFNAPVPLHSKLMLNTYGIGFSRITAQRGYEAHIVGREDDEPVIKAHTLWVYIDARGRPARLPEGTAHIWLPDGPVPQKPEAPLPAFPETTPAKASTTVHFSDIDLMQHMNNAAYVEALDNAAWEACATAGITPETAQFTARRYDIEYLESARIGEDLEIQTWFDPTPLTGTAEKQEITRLQRITRADSVLVRACSHWQIQNR